MADPGGGVPGVPRNPPFPSCYDDLTYDAHAALGARRTTVELERNVRSYVADRNWNIKSVYTSEHRYIFVFVHGLVGQGSRAKLFAESASYFTQAHVRFINTRYAIPYTLSILRAIAVYVST